MTSQAKSLKIMEPKIKTEVSVHKEDKIWFPYFDTFKIKLNSVLSRTLIYPIEGIVKEIYVKLITEKDNVVNNITYKTYLDNLEFYSNRKFYKSPLIYLEIEDLTDEHNLHYVTVNQVSSKFSIMKEMIHEMSEFDKLTL